MLAFPAALVLAAAPLTQLLKAKRNTLSMRIPALVVALVQTVAPLAQLLKLNKQVKKWRCAVSITHRLFSFL